MYCNKVKKGKHCITYTLQLNLTKLNLDRSPSEHHHPQTPQLHLSALTRARSLHWLSQLGPHGPNFNFLLNALRKLATFFKVLPKEK